MFEALLKFLTSHYVEDPTAPGLTISYIKNREFEDKFEFYVSINRFLKAFGKDKTNLAVGIGNTLDEAVKAAIKNLEDKHNLKVQL